MDRRKPGSERKQQFSRQILKKGEIHLAERAVFPPKCLRQMISSLGENCK
jgi:hypothetical protein